MAELYVLAADGTERHVPLAGAAVVFGREEGCDVVLDEQRASRRHCEVRPCGDGWKIVDLGSSNGTFLGGQPVLSARLQPGDEIVIGETIMQFAADVDAPRPRRTRRRMQKKPPWGLIGVPLALGIVIWFALGAWAQQSTQEREQTWAAFARDTVTALDLPVAVDDRAAVISAALERLPDGPEADRARRILVAGREGGSASPGIAGDDDGWRAALSGVRGSWDGLSPVDLRMQLGELLERHGGNPDASAEIARLLERLAGELTASGERDRAATAAEAERAIEEGRLGDALDLWNAWLARTPHLLRDEERAFARIQDEIAQLARDAYGKSFEQARALVAEGRRDAAEELLGTSIERLRGTGWDTWLRGASGGLGLDSGTPVATLRTAGASSTRDRALALRALASAEEMARQRLFREAAERLQRVAGEVTDATLKGEIESRVANLRAEADVLQAVLAGVQAGPAGFSPIALPDGKYRVVGATNDALLLEKDGTSLARSISELPLETLDHLFAKAPLAGRQHLSAALLLFDVGLRDAYVRSMRAALSAGDDQLVIDASAAHAFLHGRPIPDGGYAPHPERDDEIITYDELLAIRNAKKIAEMTATLGKLVEKVESSAQAKSIEKVRAAYAGLEQARNHALELIFDEVKYFYPYRDRMAEYVPVSREVDERVAGVREAWAVPAKARPKRDQKIDKLLDQIEDVRIEVEYLGGDIDELLARVDAVARYLDRELTVQTWFDTDADLALIEYNDRVMAENKVVESVADGPERRQVEVTNEYRVMFGHRPAVRINDQLTLAARGHSDDMARLGFFDHFSPVPGKKSPSDRMLAAGYPLMGGSENIHMGSGSPEGAHESWIHSSGHHRNILMPAWREMGTGRSGRHWTQNFGFRDMDSF